MRDLPSRLRIPRAAWLAAVVALFAMPGVAHAASGTYGCADLQAGLDQAATGNVITLSELCTKDNSGTSNGSFSLPSAAITLQGAAGAGFDGAGAPSRILIGHDVGGTVIAGLIFRNGQAPTGGSGGAVLIDGNSAPVFQSDQFYNNAADNLGGAVALLTPAAGTGTVVIANSVVGSRTGGAGNHATTGGAIYVQTPRRVEIRANLLAGNSAGDTGGAIAVSSSGEVAFSSNLVEANQAVAGGGGAQLCCAHLALTSNAFRANRVDDPAGAFPTHRGGGLLASSSDGGAPGQVDQFGNVFDGNALTFSTGAPSVSGGAGEYVFGSSLGSRNDLFISNGLQGAGSGGESRGAALRSTGCNGGELLTTLENDVVAGNSAGAGATGGAVSAACSAGVNHLSLLNTTVAGNVAPDNGSSIDGGGGDTLLAANSIVSPQSGIAVGGFAGLTVSYTNLCDPGAPSQPFPGEGNICADPRLVNPAPGAGNFHQTPSSPTIDAGSNALVAQSLGVDVDGDSRATDGNGDGNEVVDMGADESPAVPLIPPQDHPRPPVQGPDTPGPPTPIVEVQTKPNKPVRVVYVRVLVTKHHGRYLLTRITGSGKARIRLRLLDSKHRSHSVVRTVRTNRAVTVKNLPLVGVRLIRISVIR